MLEKRTEKAQHQRVEEALRALRERVEERDVLAATLAASAEQDPTSALHPSPIEDDPMIFESRAKGPDLRVLVLGEDSIDSDIQLGYQKDSMLSKIIDHPKHHPDFTVRDGYVWHLNKGGEEVLCIPTDVKGGPQIHGHIIERAHVVVGHFGPQRTADYIRRWYWWPRLQLEVEKFCSSCELCLWSKGEYRLPSGKLHTLPIPVRPWDSIGMDFVSPFPESDSYNYLWVIVCRMTTMVHLIPVNTMVKASELSDIYLCEVVRLHGIPSSIISNQDPKFTSK